MSHKLFTFFMPHVNAEIQSVTHLKCLILYTLFWTIKHLVICNKASFFFQFPVFVHMCMADARGVTCGVLC